MNGMSTERFHYSGPAEIDRVSFPEVQFQERPSEGRLRSWEGATSFSAANTPVGFTANMGGSGPVTVQLPDGRQGQAFVSNVGFDGSRWTVDLMGTGPTPRLPE